MQAQSYPDGETYSKLYARYYGRDVGELLNLLEPMRDCRFLDLCGGQGLMSIGAINAGCKNATLVDAAFKMVLPELFDHPLIKVLCGEVKEAFKLMLMQNYRYERVSCRQAINYWLNQDTAKSVADILTPGGIFVFNTFNQKPPEKPRVMEYELGGCNFVEVSWLVGNMVHHVQIRDGLEPHQTSFKWLPPGVIHGWLEPYFEVTEERKGRSSIYRCIKK